MKKASKYARRIRAEYVVLGRSMRSYELVRGVRIFAYWVNRAIRTGEFG